MNRVAGTVAIVVVAGIVAFGVARYTISQELHNLRAWGTIATTRGLATQDPRGKALQHLYESGDSLVGVDLSGGAILTGLNAPYAEFVNADFQEAKITRSDLQGARFNDANCEGTRFEDVNLRGSHFEDANLRDTVWRRVDLTHASLRGADIAGAELWGARGVTWEQVKQADNWGAAMLPDNLLAPLYDSLKTSGRR